MKGTTQEVIAKEVVDLAIKRLGGKDASEISYQVPLSTTFSANFVNYFI